MSKLPVILSGIILLSIIPFAFAEYEDTLVMLKTNSGDLVIEFFPNDAPNHVENFIKLSSNLKTELGEKMASNTALKYPSNSYENTLFHRVIPGFMIQGGDINTRENADDDSNWGHGNLGYFIKAEFNDIKHDRGIVSMARSPDPNSAGTQFFIVHQDSTFLDGQYTVFGRLVTQQSFETLDKIVALETGQRDIPVDRNAPKIIETLVLERSTVDDLLELDPPERTTDFRPDNLAQNTGRYVDEELGFSFFPPIGWAVSNPEQINKNSPQVAVLGPVGSPGIPAAFAVNVKGSSSTLDEHVLDFKNMFLSAIDSGAMKIISEDYSKHAGFESYIIIFQQDFTSNQTTTPLKMKLLLIKTPNTLYSLQFTNSLAFYQTTEGQFDDILDSFTLKQRSSPIEKTTIQTTTTETESQSSKGGGCLIATAAYGSEMAPQVQFLREIRDNTVLQTQSGTSFMTAFNTFFYTFSPAVADYERENPVFKEAVKVGLTPLLTSLTILNYVDIDTEQEMLGYGIGIIMLNIGMYFVAPAIVIIAIKNRRRLF